MRALATMFVALALLASGCGGLKAGTRTIVVAVDAPFSKSPFIGKTIANGGQLAADQLEAQGLSVDGHSYRIRILHLDNALSPSQAVSDTRRALREHAAAIVTDGTGVDATWRLAAKDHVPIAITYQGGSRLVDPE